MDGRWNSGEPWVFTSYLAGSFDNLAELLHETGHAIHIAAIRTRPAYMDWPDNDTFTEALADFPAMELYEPAWQIRFLGDSVTLAESLRAKYAGIVFDVAWGLFELRMDRNPSQDPNQLWTDITQHLLQDSAPSRVVVVGDARAADRRAGLPGELRDRCASSQRI